MARGFIRGTHHLTFCVGGAQEDYDFHVRAARPEERQEDRAVRRRDPGLPPLLRQPPGRPEHAAHGVPVPPGRLDGQARHQPGQVAATSRCRRTRSASGPTACPSTASSTSAASDSDRAPVLPPSVRDRVRDRRRGRSRTTASRTRAPACPRQHAIRGAYGTTTSVREPDPMSFFVTEGMGGKLLVLRGCRTTSSRSATSRATAGCSSWSRSPTFRRGRGTSARARSTTRRSTWSRPRTSRRSRTGSSGSGSPTSPSPRTAATSSRCTAAARAACWSRSPTGTPQGFLIDEAADELGTHMCIPPHWENRRSEISQLEPIETIETVVG